MSINIMAPHIWVTPVNYNKIVSALIPSGCRGMRDYILLLTDNPNSGKGQDAIFSLLCTLDINPIRRITPESLTLDIEDHYGSIEVRNNKSHRQQTSKNKSPSAERLLIHLRSW